MQIKRFNIYDSTGTLLRGGFSSKKEAEDNAWAMQVIGHCRIKEINY